MQKLLEDKDDLGRLNIIHNKIIINISIYFDRVLRLVLNKLNLSKFIFFIANFEIKKK